MAHVHHDADHEAPRPSPSGGAGLYDHSSRDPFPRWAGWASGLAAVVASAVIGFTLFTMNGPAFASGAAFGTRDQIGVVVSGPVAPTTIVVEPGSPAEEGKQLIGSKGCGSCHTIPGLATAHGTIGPNLAGLAGKATIAAGAVPVAGPDDLKHWILNPPAVKPGTAMPNLGLSDDEATKIVAYLELLK
jgi:cytochrome c